MSKEIGEARSPGGGQAVSLLASRRHTLYFLAIWLGVTAVSVLSAILNPGVAKSQGPNNMIPFYLFLIGMQALWVRFVYKGMQRAGRSLLEFFSLPRFGPAPLVQDIGYAALSYALIYACGALIGHWSAPDAQQANLMLPQLPTAALALTVWIGLSLSAGLGEEILFRGYLQRQLSAMTGRPVLAILVQAMLFWRRACL